MIELDNNIKRVIVTMSRMFKNLEETFNVLFRKKNKGLYAYKDINKYS